VAVDGAFKAPTLRNVELTGPYMHNGSMKNLTEVVQFYTRGADFEHANLQDLDSDVSGIPLLQGHHLGIASVVEFLEHLTDPRVKYQKAPFDHPELILVNGHESVEWNSALDVLVVLPETGSDGGAPLQTFEDALTNGLNLVKLPTPEKPVSPAAAAGPAYKGPASVSAADANGKAVVRSAKVQISRGPKSFEANGPRVAVPAPAPAGAGVVGGTD
jgi:hypothetical protein